MTSVASQAATSGQNAKGFGGHSAQPNMVAGSKKNSRPNERNAKAAAKPMISQRGSRRCDREERISNRAPSTRS